MKLSDFRAMLTHVEADAKAHGVVDPVVSFWFTHEIEKAVGQRIPARGVFIDVEPDVSDQMAWHRVMVSGPQFGQYHIPLALCKVEA